MPGGPGVRIDSHLYAGYTVPPYYDSLVAKLLVSGRDRGEAIERARRALSMLQVEGIKTNAAMHLRILEDDDFQAGKVDTHFMERFLKG
jgi:acetyl-CoA carboxylase biotin carboxylase subunit